MKKWTDIIEKLTMLTQLSLSLVTPLLLCLGLCWWSSNRWSLGGWMICPLSSRQVKYLKVSDKNTYISFWSVGIFMHTISLYIF